MAKAQATGEQYWGTLPRCLPLGQTHYQGNQLSQLVLTHQSKSSLQFRGQELTSWSRKNYGGNFAFFSDHFASCVYDLWTL